MEIEPRSTGNEASAPTITPLNRFVYDEKLKINYKTRFPIFLMGWKAVSRPGPTQQPTTWLRELGRQCMPMMIEWSSVQKPCDLSPVVPFKTTLFDDYRYLGHSDER